MSLDIHVAARKFADDLQCLLNAVLPLPTDGNGTGCEISVINAGAHYVVHPGGMEPAPLALTSNGRWVASLRISFQCVADSSRDYLAVSKSVIELKEARDRTPLLRLDYIREAERVPAAHWNVHAERGSLSRLLAVANPEHTSLLSKVHLPVGGARYRPCLEDVLQMLITEFRIDCKEDAIAAIEAGRERWRRFQIGASVRDAPDVAVNVLEKLGYNVAPPEDGLRKPNLAALRRW